MRPKSGPTDAPRALGERLAWRAPRIGRLAPFLPAGVAVPRNRAIAVCITRNTGASALRAIGAGARILERTIPAKIDPSLNLAELRDLGGGIHYAIESAALLADSLAGGEPYEGAMAPTVAEVTGMAKSIELNYFMRCLQIIRFGTA